MPRYVTVSEMEDFLRDEWRWYAKWVLNRVPRKWSDALILGTAVHDVFESYFKGTPLVEAWDAVDAALVSRGRSTPEPGEALVISVARKDFAKYRPQIVTFKEQFLSETLEVERAFVLPLRTNWVLRGRPDRVVRYRSKIYHQQHKTLAKNKSVATFAVLTQRSMHEGLYGYYLGIAYPHESYGGTMLNVVRKGVAKSDLEVPQFSFQTIVAVDATDRLRAYMRAVAIAHEMERAEKVATMHGINALIDSPKMDGGLFGNSLDGYLPVLRGKAKLDDDNLFMEREKTYADTDA